MAWPAGDLALLEEVTWRTAAESRAARQTGRVVILMGKASLGRPPLWAAPGPGA